MADYVIILMTLYDIIFHWWSCTTIPNNTICLWMITNWATSQKLGGKKNIEWACLFHTIEIMRIRFQIPYHNLQFFGISFFFLKNACSPCQKFEWSSHAQWLVYLVGMLVMAIVFTTDVALGSIMRNYAIIICKFKKACHEHSYNSNL